MALSPPQRAFLEEVDSFNERFNAILVGTQTKSLVHCFWSAREIEDGLRKRADWDVSEHLVPFYGDWHDLICLDSQTDKILWLDDQRRVMQTWDAIKEFVQCLSLESDELLDDDSGVIEAWLDPDL